MATVIKSMASQDSSPLTQTTLHIGPSATSSTPLHITHYHRRDLLQCITTRSQTQFQLRLSGVLPLTISKINSRLLAKPLFRTRLIIHLVLRGISLPRSSPLATTAYQAQLMTPSLHPLFHLLKQNLKCHGKAT